MIVFNLLIKHVKCFIKIIIINKFIIKIFTEIFTKTSLKSKKEKIYSFYFQFLFHKK